MSTITRTSLVSLFSLLLLCTTAVAQSQPQLIVTVESGTPTPDPITTGQTTSTTFNIALDAPQNVHQELQQDGADQSYTIQLTNDSGTSDGNPVSVTISGSTLKDDGRIGDFDIDFDRANSRVTISSHQDTGLLSSVGVVASFTSYGLKHINLDGSATIDGNTYNDDDGGRAEVTVMDFHIRADTNVDTNINENDDPTADSPGLFVALNTDDDDSNSTADREQTSQVAGEDDLELGHMVLDPIMAIDDIEAGDPAYVKLSRSNNDVRVWRTSDKDGWNGLGGALLVGTASNTWDLTDSDSRSRFMHDRTNLYIEGYNPGTATLTLELTDSAHNVILTDTLVVNMWGVQILVNQTETPDDDIVCRRSTNPAGRPEIACQARLLNSTQNMTVYLENGGAGGAGELRFGQTTGNATAQNVSVNLPSNGNPVTFYISGETESQAMRDAVIRAKEDDSSGEVVGQVPATVIWVALSRRSSAAQSASGDNSARNTYVAVVGTESLGLVSVQNDGRIGWGFELVGDVVPNNFGDDVVLGRDIQARWYMDGANGSTEINGVLFPDGRGYSSTNFSNALPGNDQSPAALRENTPAKIFDLDAPGLWADGLNRPQGTIQRFRANFRQYAYYDYDGNPNTTDDMVRCSDDIPFWFRMSYRQAGAGNDDDWQPHNDINNDNQTGAGTTGIAWNSQN